MTKQEQINEAIERMKMLKLHENAINEFQNEGKLNLSEGTGALYWLDEKQQAYVTAFEEKYKSLVYHIIHNNTEFGELLAFLYVSNDEIEWGYDRDDIKEGYACAYVENLDEPTFSEFGSIGIKPLFGGVIRTA
ncbi:MAG: hypothetical protein RR313_11630 [Anaerovoracaceae bacterium]